MNEAQHQLLAKVVAALDGAGIAHMVTGSYASSYHGEPRMTRDIDLVVAPDPVTVSQFVDQFEADDFYVDDAVAAVKQRAMFNLIEIKTGWKVDLIVRKDRPYSIEEFSRRTPAVVGGVSTSVATAEDTILSKLEWSRASRSDQQRRDIAAIIHTRGGSLDWSYLRHWADELGLIGELEAMTGGGAS